MLSAGKETKGLTEFYLDGPEDIKDLPTTCAPGSTATAQVFMLNHRDNGLNYN